MTNISIKATGAFVVATANGKLTSGMIGVPVNIEYDSAWDGLLKTAVFRVGNFARDRKNIQNTTTVPWEVMRNYGGVLEVGLEGRDADGNVVMPTVWASVGTIYRGANSTIPGAPNPESEPSSGGDIPSTAVLYTPQALTAAQQKQARENIGAAAVGEAGGGSRLVVTVADFDGAAGRASHTSEQIYEHIQNGGTAVLLFEDDYYPISRCYVGEALFFNYSHTKLVDYTIDDTGLFEYGEANGSSVLVVTIDGDTASHNPSQILAHIAKGGLAVLRDNEEYYALLSVVNGTATFGTLGTEQTGITYFINADGDAMRKEQNYGGGGRIAPLYVTIDPDTELASEPAQRIVDYIMNGGNVLLRNGTNELAFTHTDGSSCYFTEITAEDNYVRQVIVHDDGTYEGFSYQAASKGEVNNKITAPTKAEVGQTIVVKSVDSNGKPTAWECADLPSGGSSEWKVIADITTTEEVTTIRIEKDINENPFKLIDAMISITVANTDTNEGEAALQIRTNTNTAAAGGTNTSAIRMFRKGTGANHIALRLIATDNYIAGTIHNIGNTSSAIAGYFNKITGQHFSALYLTGGTFGVGSRVLIEGVRA